MNKIVKTFILIFFFITFNNYSCSECIQPTEEFQNQIIIPEFEPNCCCLNSQIRSNRFCLYKSKVLEILVTIDEKIEDENSFNRIYKKYLTINVFMNNNLIFKKNGEKIIIDGIEYFLNDKNSSLEKWFKYFNENKKCSCISKCIIL